MAANDAQSPCCWIGGWRNLPCGAPGEWVIVSGPTDTDVTYACTSHVGELLNDAPEHRIYPMSDRPGGGD